MINKLRLFVFLSIFALSIRSISIDKNSNNLEESSLSNKEDEKLLSNDPLGSHLISWWLMWHEHYNQMKEVMNKPNLLDETDLLHTESSSSLSSSSSLDLDLDLNDPTQNLILKSESELQRLQQVQDMMKEKLQAYWEYLSNTTLHHQQSPRVKNAEIHSDGIFNNVLTASIEFDRAEDEEKLVSKYWFRFSSDCTDMGKINPDLPPVLILQTDPVIQKYQTILGPISVPEGAQCLLIYSADKVSQPFPDPVPILLPQFRYPKPVYNIASHCKVGWEGCFDRNSTGTSCESLIGKNCCKYPMCIGCGECSQIRNLQKVQKRPKLNALGPSCTDRWDRQGFATKFGFSCAQAISWGIMDCRQDSKNRLCFKTCAFCDPAFYPPELGEKPKDIVLPTSLRRSVTQGGTSSGTTSSSSSITNDNFGRFDSPARPDYESIPTNL